jgi:hypothetical protein
MPNAERRRPQELRYALGGSKEVSTLVQWRNLAFVGRPTLRYFVLETVREER